MLPEGDDERVLRAAEALLRRGVVTLTLLWDGSEVEAKAAQLGVSIAGADVVDPHRSPLREEFAAQCARRRAHRGVTPQSVVAGVLEKLGATLEVRHIAAITRRSASPVTRVLTQSAGHAGDLPGRSAAFYADASGTVSAR